jgi:hypothetical protein
MQMRLSLPKPGTVLGAIKTKPLRGGLPARLDSPCARRLWISTRPGRGKAIFNRTGKYRGGHLMPAQ